MNETIEIRKRDMVNSCPLGDELKLLKENNARLLDAVKAVQEHNVVLINEKEDLKKLHDLLTEENQKLRGTVGELKSNLKSLREKLEYWEGEACDITWELSHLSTRLENLKDSIYDTQCNTF